MSKKSQSPTIRALVEREGRSLREIANDYAARGYSRAMAAEALGIRKDMFCHALRRECPDVAWPAASYSPRARAAKRSAAELQRQTKMRKGEIIVVEIEGRHMTLKEAARIVGITPEGMWRRYKIQGLRGADLLVPPRSSGPHPTLYEVGASVRDMHVILRHAEQRGIRSAVAKFGIPQGAIGAMQRGEWEKVA